MTACYILTDRLGYTTALAAPADKSPEDVMRSIRAEVQRCNMFAPTTCFHWQRGGHYFGDSLCGWKLIQTWKVP